MSYPLGTKVRLIQPWRAYSVGAVLEQGFEVDLEELVRLGFAEPVQAKKKAPPRRAPDVAPSLDRALFR